MPTWLPPSHIRFVMDDYGINHFGWRDQAEGAGAPAACIVKLDALAEAQRVANESQYLADRNAMLHDGQWVAHTLKPAIDETLRRIVEKVAELRAQTGMPLEGGAQGQHVVMTGSPFSLVAGWQQKFFGNVEQDAHFWVREFFGPIGEWLMYVHSPKMLREYQFTTDITLTRELCWPLGKAKIPANEFPDRIVKMFPDLYLQANEGKGRDAADRMRR